MGNCATGGKRMMRHFAEGGITKKETPDELMARMAAKYGTPTAGPATQQPAVPPAPPPVQQPQPKPQQGPGSGIFGILKGRAAQIDKASGYANGKRPEGAMIDGPGTPTSDSIDAEVHETGEPIKVSRNERIVSHAQNKLLENIAQGIGFKNLDSLLEAGTGKPVGPTVKGGKDAAAYGKQPETEDTPYGPYTGDGGGIVSDFKNWQAGKISSTNAKIDAAMGKTQSPVAQPTISGIARGSGIVGGENSAPRINYPFSGSERGFPAPSANTSFITGNAKFDAFGKPTGSNVPSSDGGGFVQGNRAYNVNPTSQEGVQKVTSAGKSPLFTNIRPEDAVTGLKDQTIGGDAQAVQQGLDRFARANEIRQSMIDSQPQGGVSIMGDGGIDAANAEKTARWRQDDLLAMAKGGNRAAGDVAATVANGQNQIAVEGLRQVGQFRGQDLNFASDMARNGITARGQDVTMRGQDIGAQSDAQRLDITRGADQRAGDKWSIDKTILQGQMGDANAVRAARSELSAAMESGDAAKIKAARIKAEAAGIKFEKPNNEFTAVTNQMGGTTVLDKTTGAGSIFNVQGKKVADIPAPGSQITPQQEYQAAIARAAGNPDLIAKINERAKANGVIQ